MYDVIYFNVWSDIICTAAKLLHGTSLFSEFSLSQAFVRQVSIRFWFNEDSLSPHREPDVAGLHLIYDKRVCQAK